MLEGSNWNETQFDLKGTILNFRKYISKTDEDIFGNTGETNEIDAVKQEFPEFSRKRNNCKVFRRIKNSPTMERILPKLRKAWKLSFTPFWHRSMPKILRSWRNKSMNWLSLRRALTPWVYCLRALHYFLKAFPSQYTRNFKNYRKIHDKAIKNKTSGVRKSPELKKFHKYVRQTSSTSSIWKKVSTFPILSRPCTWTC